MSASTIALRLVIGGDAKGAKAALHELGAGSKKAGDDLGRGLKAAQGAAAVGLTAIVGLGAAGVASYKNLTASVASLQRQSKISAEDASLLVGQWQRYGVSIEAGTRATTLMSKAIFAVNTGAKGSDAAAKAFSMLGISFEELKLKTPAEVMERVRDVLSKMPPSAAKTAISATLMGRGFQSMSKWVNASSTDLEALNQQLRDTGQVMNEAELAKAKDDMKQMALLQVDLRGLFVEVGRAAVPVIRELVPPVKQLLGVAKPLAPHLVKIGGALAAFLVATKVAAGLNAMMKALAGIKALLAGGKLAAGIAEVAGGGGAGTFVTKGGQTVAGSLIPGAAGAGGGAGGAAATVGMSAAAASAASVGVMAAAAALPLILARTQKHITEDMTVSEKRNAGQSGGGSFWGSSKGYGGGSGKARMDLAENRAKELAAAAAAAKATIDAAIAHLGAAAEKQTGKAFSGTLKQIEQLRQLAAKKIPLGNIDKAHTDRELWDARNLIMKSLGVTKKDADALMSTLFKDWRPQATLMPKMNITAEAAEERLKVLRKRFAVDLAMGGINSKKILQEIGNVSRSFDGMTAAARRAYQAAQKAFSASGRDIRDRPMPRYASGGWVAPRPGGLAAVLAEGGEGEYIVPQSKVGRFAAAAMGSRGGGTTTVINNHFSAELKFSATTGTPTAAERRRVLAWMKPELERLWALDARSDL